MTVDPYLNLAHAAPDRQGYLSIKGTRRISQDEGGMTEIWNSMMKSWFPQEPDSSGHHSIIVTAQSAE